ncbi:MAG: integrase arm-type DNA-binding domain-containing protein [Halopseudomonas sp.]|uniref:tyrosine-type recombinase/integrase n=1 Tax=Halopseudomonas sp. TaxID=2901191 RepID=UPI003002AA8E
MGKFNPKQVENLTDPGTYEDGDGLRLVIKKTGRKYWVMRFQLNGKRRDMSLGAYPDVSLKSARSKTAIHRERITNGLDPISEREANREAERAAAATLSAKQTTFDGVAADYIAAHRPGWKNAKHAQQWENTLNTYASPFIGKLSPGDITTEDVLKVLQPIWTTKPETASRVRNRIELVLDAAKARRLREGENPARWRGHLDKLLPKREKVQAVKHHAALPWSELPAFMAKLRKLDKVTFKAMQMTILTACRTSEVLGATWDEIDLQARVWTVPAERMKMRKEHRVPLADALVEVLEQLPRYDDNPHLFPGMKAGKPLSNMAMLMGLRHIKRDDLTMHGFRSTFRDWAGECTPHPRDVCEQALAHSLGNAVEAAYRRGDLFEKRRALMDDWAHYITTAPTEKVIQGNFSKKSG